MDLGRRGHAWLNATGGTAWQIGGGSWVNGNWNLIKTRAKDGAGTPETPGIGLSFRVLNDPTPPSSAVVIPTNNGAYRSLNQVTGTASDNFTVTEVRISIKNVTDTTWWGGGAFDAPSEVASWSLVTGTTAWTYVNPGWVDGKQYLVKSRAKDQSDNTENPSAGVSFYYDTTGPTSYVTFPTNNAWRKTMAVNISGQASDLTTLPWFP